ncbi:CLUMA_CG008875, isoform A [Clunio marinus]|uniref:CLUMA_CG008875, isoform A n=1 Tax=Clunio marinus TaxID=568069 RepID=A0A1J1I4R8_9DIPT|nr:CLUMA_CG008875, isoform A [Clunio marinus]
MQLMTFNSLLMFDIVFIFFLFLIAVTCLLYYLPPVKIKHKSHLDRRRSQQSVTVASSNSTSEAIHTKQQHQTNYRQPAVI